MPKRQLIWQFPGHKPKQTQNTLKSILVIFNMFYAVANGNTNESSTVFIGVYGNGKKANPENIPFFVPFDTVL